MRAPLEIEDIAHLSHDDETSDEEGNEKKDDIPGSYPDKPDTRSNAGSYY